jgi:hypothetical protein
MKKILFVLISIGITLAVVPMFAAFEAHVVSVTAKIKASVEVPVGEFDYGEVFPQEIIDLPFEISLSDSFIIESDVVEVNYIVRQKPMCGITSSNGERLFAPLISGVVVPDGQGGYTVDCGQPPRNLDFNEDWGVLPLLCPYIGKKELTTDGTEIENDGFINPFHQPFEIQGNNIVWNDVLGRMSASAGDIADAWELKLVVPCFGSGCGQDWENYVRSINPNVLPGEAAQYVEPPYNIHKVFGCDVWVEAQ